MPKKVDTSLRAHVREQFEAQPELFAPKGVDKPPVEFDPTTVALLVECYKQAEDLAAAGWLRRLEVGWLLFELMDQIGETHLRRVLPGFCRELSWDAATRAMRLARVVDREFLEASCPPNFEG